MHLLKMILPATGKKGVPQGGVISPLLSNLYLNEVDRMLEKAVDTTRRGKSTSVQYARFADDMVILIDAERRSDWLGKAIDKRLGEEFAKINPILRGWVNCFRVGHSSICFGVVKRWVEEKVRRHLMRARGRKGFGWTRWSSEWLYDRLGLFNNYQLRRWSGAKVAPAR